MPTLRDQQLIEYCTTRPWLMYRDTLEAFVHVLHAHAKGEKPPEDRMAEIADIQAARSGTGMRQQVIGSVAIVPLTGVIARFASQVQGISHARGTGIDAFAQAMAEAVGNPRVKTILIHIDSPGGTVDHITDGAQAVHDARESGKRVVALADGIAASAAYWIGSQADEFHATDTTPVGSIGVYQVLVDDKGFYEQHGLKMHLVTTGPHKGAGAPGIEISDEQLQGFQANVDHYFGMFRDAVVRGRGFESEQLDRVTTGQVWPGSKSVAMGLSDSVTTFDALLGRLQSESTAAAAATTTRGMMTKPDDAAAETVDEQAPVDTGAKTPEASTPAAQDAPSAKEIREEAIAAERERASTIRSMAFDGQGELVAKLIDDGTPVAEAAIALNKAHKAATMTTGETLGGAPNQSRDGDGSGVEEFDEKTGAKVPAGSKSTSSSANSFDYAKCVNEEAVAALAKIEWDTLDEGTKAEIADHQVETWISYRKGEWRTHKAFNAGINVLQEI